MEPLAKRLGDRLVTIGMAVKGGSASAGWPHVHFSVGSERYSTDQVCSYQFWIAVAEVGEMTLWSYYDSNNVRSLGKLDRSQIQALFPEALDVNLWAENDASANRTALEGLDNDITFLRGADFKDLAAVDRFTISTDDGSQTFAFIINATMKSQLARDLVQMGYLDRNFTLYAAQFYGHFTGVDVANFIVQSVETNTMDIDYTFSGPKAITNLLSETSEDFSHTVSAYNIEILDYLLNQNDARATDIADSIGSNFDDQAQEFLRAYLNSGSERARLAALLSRHPWPRVFTYVIHDPGIPADIRPALVDAALHYANEGAAYEMGPEVRDFIVEKYLDMAVFTSPQDDGVTDKIVALIKRIGVVFPRLAGLEQAIRDRVVHEHLYFLTADNLREALGAAADVGFDRVRENRDVYDRCLADPNEYLIAVKNDIETPYSVLTATTLTAVLSDVADAWEPEQIEELIAMASPGSRLENLDAAPISCWPSLAANHLFSSNARNALTYRDAIGSIDQNLATLLARAGTIDTSDADDDVAMKVAIAVLNASGTIPDAHLRVRLVVSLHLKHYVEPAQIEPEAGDLLKLLLEHNVIIDSLESFAQFRGAGWEALEPAITKSTNFVKFMTPDLVSDFIADLLGSHTVPQQARDKIVDNLAQFAPEDDAAALSAAGRYVLARGRRLPLDQVRRVAAVTRDKTLTLRLLTATPLPPAGEVVAVLSELGEPYSYLATRAKNRFEVPNSEEHRAVFNHLKANGIVAEFKKRRLKDVCTVTLPST
jgi:hypothetical protein